MTKTLTPIAAAFVISVAATPLAAAENPFAISDLSSGYSVAMGDKPDDSKSAEGKCGEGKCGESKKKEAKCGEGKCGEGKKKEAKCGEGKCGTK